MSDLAPPTGVLRRVARHTGVMGAGKVAGGLIHLASLALAARMLGPLLFGILMLVRSYVQTAGGLAKFQSWQAVVRYGTPLVGRSDRRGFASLIALTGGIDLGTGVLAMLIAMGLLPVIGKTFGMDQSYIAFAFAYCLAIPGMAATTPTGVLRLFDRFDQLAWQGIVTPVVRLAGLCVAWMVDAPFWGYWVAWFVSDLVGDGYLWVAGWLELRKRAMWSADLDGPRATIVAHPGILRFITSTNLSGTLDTLFGPLAALVIGARLGAASAGQFRMALAVLDAVGKPAELAMRSFYPEIARLKDQGHGAHFRQVVLRAVMIAAPFGAVVAAILALIAPAFITTAMGADYRPVVLLLQVAGLSVLGSMIVFPLEAALLAHGHAGRILVARGVATAAGFGLLFWSLGTIGLVGACWALVLTSAVLAVLLAVGFAHAERTDSSV